MNGRRMQSEKLGGWAFLGFLVIGLAAMLATEPARGVGETEQDGPLKAVVHVNFAKTTDQRIGLKNVENILKTAAAEGIKAEIEVVCHGEGIRLVEKARTELADEVAAMANQSVRFVACENTMRERSLGREDLLPGVATVPSGAFEIVRRQQDGYSYFKP
jgi:intracellular sulfur oxidation DsrE/DsrF family protein